MVDQYQDEQHFKMYRSTLQGAVARYDKRDKDLGLHEDLTERQRRQVDGLAQLERDFKVALLKSDHGHEAYKAFVEHIKKVRCNILDARPYFRERADVFTAEISGVLKADNYRGLFKFHFNFRFCSFVMSHFQWDKESDVYKLFEQIKQMRQEICIINAPLQINRARLFYKRTPKSHLDYMDLVQTAAEGMLAAIDKYTGPYETVFRAVAIGRMTGNFIESYSETPLHFFPNDKRKLYRANKIVGRGRGEELNYESMAAEVNRGVENAPLTTPSEIANLLAAASCVSANSQSDSDDEDGLTPYLRFAAPASEQPDVLAEKNDRMDQMLQAIRELPMTQQKIMRLKGLHF